METLTVAVGTEAFRWLTGNGFFAKSRRQMGRRVFGTFEVPKDVAEEFRQKVR